MLTVAGWLFLNGVAIIPGLFLLGLAVAQYGLVDTLDRRGRQLAIVVALLFAVTFLLLLRTPLRRPLDAVFAPMGRLALTNYVLASLLILLADGVLDLGDASGYGPIVAVGAVIGVVQAVLSVVWLRWFRYGPLEWVWRCLTWWQWVPMRGGEPVAAAA